MCIGQSGNFIYLFIYLFIYFTRFKQKMDAYFLSPVTGMFVPFNKHV